MIFVLDDVDERTRNGTTAASMFFNLYSSNQLYGQSVAYGIWAVACIILVFLNRKPAKKIVHFIILFLFISFILQLCRYILVSSGTKVGLDYRYEFSFATMFQRIGISLLLLAVMLRLQLNNTCHVLSWFVMPLLFIMNLVYVIKGFIISKSAIYQWKRWTGIWPLINLDLGLSMTPSMIREFKGAQRWTYVDFMKTRMAPLSPYDYRTTQMHIGVATDALTLLLLLFFLAGLLMPRRPLQGNYQAIKPWLAATVTGLLLHAVFRVIVAIHFILWNWMVLRSESTWDTWMEDFLRPRYNSYPNIPTGEYAPESFLEGYRAPCDAFPVIQAALEPMGIFLACAALSYANRAQANLADKDQPTVMQPIEVGV